MALEVEATYENGILTLDRSPKGAQ